LPTTTPCFRSTLQLLFAQHYALFSPRTPTSFQPTLQNVLPNTSNAFSADSQ
jgi:hypothetical protein